VCLPFFKEYGIPEPENLLAANTTGIVAGWGRTIWSKLQGSAVLMDVKLPIVPNPECQNFFKKRVQVTENQICAGGEKGKDSCGGMHFFTVYSENSYHYQSFKTEKS